MYPIRRPNVHELRQTVAIVPQFVTSTGSIEKSPIFPEQLRNLELDRIPGGVGKIDWFDLSAVGKSPTKARERERRYDICTFEQLRVIADLPELHH